MSRLVNHWEGALRVRAPFVVCVVCFAGLILALGGVQTHADTAWEPPDGGFGDYLVALQKERYTALVFRRMSRGLLAGDARSANALFTSYMSHRKAIGGGDTTAQQPDLVLILADIRSGLRSAAGAGGIEVPEAMAEAVIAQARAIAAQTFDLAFGAPDVPAMLGPQDGASAAEAETGAARRAETSGLLYDAADFVAQPHLRFVFGGTGPEAIGRLVAELMRIAVADGFIADENSVTAFLDRLVDDAVLPASEKAHVRATVRRELSLRVSHTPPSPRT
jgi:hypothetical protein